MSWRREHSWHLDARAPKSREQGFLLYPPRQRAHSALRRPGGHRHTHPGGSDLRPDVGGAMRSGLVLPGAAHVTPGAAENKPLIRQVEESGLRASFLLLAVKP